MRNLLVILFVATAHMAFSQQFSAGMRTGVGCNFYLNNKEASKPHNTTWDKQGFVRYETKGRLALELAADHYGFTTKPAIPDYQFFEAPTHRITDITQKTTNYGFSLSLQYDISCKKMQEHCPIAKNLKSYVGIVLQPVLSRYKTTYTTESLSDKSVSKDDVYNRSSTLFAGLSHTLIYDLSKNLAISSVLSYKLDATGAFQNQLAYDKSFENHFNYQVGLGYKF